MWVYTLTFHAWLSCGIGSLTHATRDWPLVFRASTSYGNRLPSGGPGHIIVFHICDIKTKKNQYYTSAETCKGLQTWYYVKFMSNLYVVDRFRYFWKYYVLCKVYYCLFANQLFGKESTRHHPLTGAPILIVFISHIM